MSHDNIDEIRASLDHPCYSYDFECQIYDNYIFKTQGGGTYELFLNAASACCVNATNVGFTKTFGRTFKENDPIRQMADGYPPEHAAFQSKINGGYFIPNICDDTEYYSDLNTEPINFYNYRLSSTQTEYVTLESNKTPDTIHDKRNKTLGEVWCRNTLSTKIQPISELIPSLKQYPQIYNNIVDFNVVYDTVLLYTSNAIYIDRLVYDYATGEFTQAPVAPIIIEAEVESDNKSHIIKSFFNEDKRELLIGRTVLYNNEVVPDLYRYSLDTGSVTVAYSKKHHARDFNKIRLPHSISKDYDLHETGHPHISYNETLHKYTVTFTGRLSANREKLINDAGTDYSGRIFCVFIYNYKDTSAGLELLDSVVYHPTNKGQYNYVVEDANRSVDLIGRGYHVDLQSITDAKTTVVIDPKNVIVREHKLKEIRYIYRETTQTTQRLPVNDMYYADLPGVMDMVEGYRGHRCGGPTDFASPRYRPVTINLDLNLEEVSAISIVVQAIYFDGHVEEWNITGEARPAPIDVVLQGLKLIDTKSYTTDTNTCLLKLVFESQEPKNIAEFIILNNGEYEKPNDPDFDFFVPPPTPQPSPTPTPTPTAG